MVQEQYNNNNGIPGIPQTWKPFISSNQKPTILKPSSQLKPALIATKVNMAALKIQTSPFPLTIISASLTSSKRSYNSPGNTGDHLQLTRGKDHNWRRSQWT
ncbi:hypothetical protein AVEN_222548-1 [Araneus ventricosus]|uniref:Uncharacterized protein n=1 Tax=Araneus ventricosus TaxID=182803 RepID=A0A4Y2GV99_ARAVE|nr:hypothetical protein AVEN_222548-1 [Araneus ventricosus]